MAHAPLPFYEEAYRELLAEDGLLVMGKGLGIERILLGFVRTHCAPTSLVFLMHVPPWLETWMRDELQADGVPSHLLPRVVNNDFDANERVELYRAGGCLLVTSRIFIVDLLSKRIPAAGITGMLVFDAHRVTEASGEAFILRLYRQANRTGFIKAFSECPESLSGGFGAVEKVMRALYVRRLYLWPRFQLRVLQALEARQPEVVELLQPLTPAMHAIQLAVIEVMEGCLAELRRTVHVDVEKLTLENGLFRSFDVMIRQQLEPVWHTTSAKTRQLVGDLRTLRRLLGYVTRYDAVAFHAYLETLRQTEGVRAAWLFLDSAQKIFRTAQQRVYLLRRVGPRPAARGRGRGRGRGGPAVGAGPSGVAPEETEVAAVLEENPKWALLRDVLAEIARDRAAPAAPPAARADAPHPTPVLVVARDERTCAQLAEFLSVGGPAMMARLFQRWALRRRGDLPQPQQQQQGGGGGGWGRGRGPGGGPGGPGGGGPQGRVRGPEDDQLVALAERLRRAERARERERREAGGGEGELPAGGGWSRRPPYPPPAKKPRCLEGGPAPPEPPGHAAFAAAGPAGADGPGAGGSGAKRARDEEPPDGPGAAEGDPGPAPAAGAEGAGEEGPYGDFVELPGAGRVVLQPQEGAWRALEELEPHYVVAHDPDVALTRRLEAFKAARAGWPLRVYFLMYETSVERQKYLSAVRREKEAFEALIGQKARMSVPAEQDGRSGAADPAALAAAHLPAAAEAPATLAEANAASRVAGGGVPRAPGGGRRVVVDVREFRSPLPGILHQRGFDVLPATLLVGDYVLSPRIVVERKSPPDLAHSLASGRLWQQAEAMGRLYRTSLLLVEFEPGRAFALQAARDIAPEVAPAALTSRLTLLALHAPALRLLWSRSPHATAALFEQLQEGEEEPDAAAAAALGAPDAPAAPDDDPAGEAQAGLDVLRRLPGVTERNAAALAARCRTLRGLVRMTEREIAEVVGGKTAHTLHEFIHAKAPL